jgi:hypothetical protein
VIKTFYAIVTERDCSEEQAKKYQMQVHGPLLFETYLTPEVANQAEAAKRAGNFANYGWVRIATVTVDVPEYCCEKGKQQGLIDSACPDCVANFGPMLAE